ncbi:hypothetical protein PVAP13_8KG107903 [Panicum virgatum]|uniref:Uncharacterized protein n=1 Tax=Panicum virgatum TaxID=38727 RepID=A0A8T0PPQ6_PANVG|nr:hypothetical protein PVAP13_8KG107903 [Panicum virgatum]
MKLPRFLTPETPPICHWCLRSPDCRSFFNGLPISPDKTPIRPPPSTPRRNISSLPLETPQSSPAPTLVNSNCIPAVRPHHRHAGLCNSSRDCTNVPATALVVLGDPPIQIQAIRGNLR